jgi:hypothetical protein
VQNHSLAKVCINQYNALQTVWEMYNLIPLGFGVLHCSSAKIHADADADADAEEDK